MSKKILRIISLALALLLLIGSFPTVQTTAASKTEEERILQQITTLYKKALKKSGLYSFHGWCGAMVDWQVLLLGITAKMEGNNGKDEFDHFKNEDYSSGGYRINAYSAKQYDLAEALNAITDNGTEDAYNILVGFQRTNTTAGRKYGHVVFIHAILNGKVYFSESFSTRFAGTYYDEGEPIVCTIKEFAKYYNSWTTLDGVIHFGLKTYMDECQFLPAYLYATVTQETQMYTAPCVPGVDERSLPVRMLQSGERVSVTGMYCNTEGEYWYQVEDAEVGYIRADHTQVQSMRYDDVSVTGVKAPTELREGNIFNLRGKINSIYSHIYSVRAQVFSVSEDGMTHMMTTTDTVTDNAYSLYNSAVSNRLPFRLLDVGAYHYELAAVIGNNYYADGGLQTEWKTVKLWLTDFQVVSQKGDTVSVTYDACGGTTELNAAELKQGQTLNTLPVATREGYTFDGWFTAPEGGEIVEDDYIVSSDITLYAHWTEAKNITGWYSEGGRAYYVVDGERIEGFFQVDGITYHQNAEGFVDIGWTEVDGMLCYFHANGAMVTGWLELDGVTCFFGTDGTATIGWAEIDDHVYYFNESGIMLTGKCTIDGQEYTFGEDGKLIQ